MNQVTQFDHDWNIVLRPFFLVSPSMPSSGNYYLSADFSGVFKQVLKCVADEPSPCNLTKEVIGENAEVTPDPGQLGRRVGALLVENESSLLVVDTFADRVLRCDVSISPAQCKVIVQDPDPNAPNFVHDVAFVNAATATTTKATTEAATTQASTTEVSTTKAATTQASTTGVSTTKAATTQASTTEVSTTKAATTQASTTEVSTTKAATTQASTTGVSTTKAATTQASTTEVSTTKAATAQASTTEVSTTKAATTQASTTEVATTKAATTEASTTEVSTTKAATTQASTTEVSTTKAATTEASTTEAATTTITTTRLSFAVFEKGVYCYDAGAADGTSSTSYRSFKEMESRDECEDLCAADVHCNYYSWYSTTERCDRCVFYSTCKYQNKSVCFDESNRAPRIYKKSSENTTRPVTQSSAKKFVVRADRTGKYCQGREILSIPVATQDECQGNCSVVSSCQFVAYYFLEDDNAGPLEDATPTACNVQCRLFSGCTRTVKSLCYPPATIWEASSPAP